MGSHSNSTPGTSTHTQSIRKWHKTVWVFVNVIWGLRAEEGGDRGRRKMAALLGDWVVFRRRRANFGWFWPRIFNCTYFSFLCSLERSVLVDQVSAFHFFARICFSVEKLEKIGMSMAWTRISVLWQWQSAEFCLSWRCKKGKECGTYEGN